MKSGDFSKNVGYALLGLFALLIGLYPLHFVGLPFEGSILGGKAEFLIQSPTYLLAFYLHISLGGLALLTGFSQFFARWRKKWPALHRALGKIYVVSVVISGTAGLGIAMFADGGVIATLGFGGLALFWLFTTLKAYIAVRNRQFNRHQRWMIRSYALCFAAVTLRIYLPLAVVLIGLEFIPAYLAISWLCWVPNLLVAEYLIIPRTGPEGRRRTVHASRAKRSGSR